VSGQKITYKVVHSDDTLTDWSVIREFVGEDGARKTELVRSYADKWKANIVAAAMNHGERERST
jgi:hypothetical protein